MVGRAAPDAERVLVAELDEVVEEEEDVEDNEEEELL
jgi:hypothetical protein